MSLSIGCDAHKRYSLFAVLNSNGKPVRRDRVNHERGAIKDYLSQFPEGTPVALESIGNWYWIVDEIEAAGCMPQMAHALKAKLLMGNINKTDKLDADGLATLQHLGSLPSVWIAPGELRDERELHRTRMALSKIRTALKNRMHSTLAKYALSLATSSDIYAPKWRQELQEHINSMPDETGRCMRQELELLDLVQEQINRLEDRIKERIEVTRTIQLLQTMPGIGMILSIVIDREVGSIDRFASHKHFASYSGTVPKVKSSGGKIRYGKMRKQSNNYLKWAFIEAANVVVRQRFYPSWHDKYVSLLYERIRRRKGHSVAVGAVARYLSEAAYWVLTKDEPYREPEPRKVLLKQGQARG
jgi:transposase